MLTPGSMNGSTVLFGSIEHEFRKLDSNLTHRLCIASHRALLSPAEQDAVESREVPCVWGERCDHYISATERCRQQVVKFRGVATEMIVSLSAFPPGVWAELLPGSMKDLMGIQSNLYCADYWTLILHHMAWTGRLPYKARLWRPIGRDVTDERFCLVSELPVSLPEGSCDAVIVLREAAINLMSRAGGEARPEALPTPSIPTVTTGTDDGPTLFDDLVINASHGEEAHDEPTLKLDAETFAVRYGEHSCRFTSRHVRMFALLDRLWRRAGRHVYFDDLRQVGDVWDGQPVEESTIRGGFSRLRKLLRKNGMDEVADWIVTGRYRNRPYGAIKPNGNGDEY